MIIYHGSTVLVEKPEIRISDSFLDFGTGFYTTTSEHKSLTGKQTAELFRRYGVVDYLNEFYDVLHTTGYFPQISPPDAQKSL